MQRSTSTRVITICVLSLAAQGCAESVLIRAYPADARIAVNGQRLGTSPATYTVPRGSGPRDGNFRYHVEREGFQPQDGSFTFKPAGGRITGGIFTLGILFLFKSPLALPDEIEVVLEPNETSPLQETRPSPAQQLRHLDDLLDRGTITEEEFKRQRNKILHNL